MALEVPWVDAVASPTVMFVETLSTVVIFRSGVVFEAISLRNIFCLKII